MTLVLETAVRNAGCDAEVDLCDIGSGANATLVIKDGAVTVVTLNFTAKATGAFGDAATGVATANAISTEAAVAAGADVDSYEVYDCNAALLWTGSVRATGDSDNGEELVISNTNIANGQDVSVTSMTHTVPA